MIDQEGSASPCLQDPQKRPDAVALQKHLWLGASRRTLRRSWADTLRGRRPGASTEPVSAVVDATLAAEEDVKPPASPTKRCAAAV